MPAHGSGSRDRGWRDRFRPHVALIVVGLVVLVVSIGLTVTLVKTRAGFMVDGDRALEASAHRAVLASSPLLTVAKVFSTIGASLTRWIVVAVVVAYLAWRRRWRVTLWLAAAFLGGLLVANGCRLAVNRPRPHFRHPVAHNPGGGSFPSGHAMGSLVLYVALFLLVAPFLGTVARWLLGTTVVLLVLAIGASRVLVGLHYTSDVVSAYVFGIGWLAVVTGLLTPWLARNPDGGRRAGPVASAKQAIHPSP
jgi:undecaprenyl-diphosphatase